MVATKVMVSNCFGNHMSIGVRVGLICVGVKWGMLNVGIPESIISGAPDSYDKCHNVSI